jgi:glycine cleavage system H protein
MNIPPELRYSTDHEWVRVEGDTVTIGITEYAQDALGDVVFVEMPEPGAAVAVGATFSEVESTKSVSDIYAPVTGSISAVNDALDSQPELLNSDPYGEGWICRIQMTDPSELDGLMDADAYRALTEGSS